MRDLLSQSLAETLHETLPVPCYAQRREGKASAPFVVARVPRAEQVEGVSGLYRAEIRLVVVTDVFTEGGSVSTKHAHLTEDVRKAFEEIPKVSMDMERGLVLHGYEITEIEEVEVRGPGGQKVYADVIFAMAGVQVL